SSGRSTATPIASSRASTLLPPGRAAACGIGGRPSAAVHRRRSPVAGSSCCVVRGSRELLAGDEILAAERQPGERRFEEPEPVPQRLGKEQQIALLDGAKPGVVEETTK